MFDPQYIYQNVRVIKYVLGNSKKIDQNIINFRCFEPIILNYTGVYYFGHKQTNGPS